jgi:hypothetical protein
MSTLLRIACVLVFPIICATGRAAAIRIETDVPSAELRAGESRTLTLRLRNESAEIAQLAVWQAGMRLTPTAGAVGAVEIYEAEVPSPYVFDGLPTFGFMPVFGTETPSAALILSDGVGDALASGTVDAAATSNLAELTIHADSSSQGVFHLVVSPHSDELLENFWVIPQTFEPLNFVNSGPEVSESERILATITVVAMPEPNSAWSIVTGVFLAIVLPSRRSK